MDSDRNRNRYSRRVFLATGTAAAAGLTFRLFHHSTPVQAMAGTGPKTVKIVQFADNGNKIGVVELPKVVKTDAEWKQQLPRQSYNILRHEDTEYPGTGSLLNEHGKGIFRCLACNTALFSSSTKFESGTGWPSFWQPIAQENVKQSSDVSFGMDRTEVKCALCDGHLGHVFDDGPRPTGLRYCMNSGALKFVKSSS